MFTLLLWLLRNDKMPGCSIKNCKNWNGNTKNTNIKYFRFPNDPEIRKRWIEACNNNKLNLQNARVCSIHFTEACFEKKPDHLIVPGDVNIFKLSKTAIPSLNLICNSAIQSSNLENVENDINAANINITGEESDLLDMSINVSNLSSTANLTISDSTIKDHVNTENPSSSNQQLTLENVCPVSDSGLSNSEDPNNYGLSRENVALKEELKKLNKELRFRDKVSKKEVKRLKKELHFRDKVLKKEIKDKVYEILRPVFTIGQINKLLNPEKSVIKWNSEDIASAIALRSVSPRGYRYLRKKNFPLAALSTLRKRESLSDTNFSIKNLYLTPILFLKKSLL